MTCYPEQCITVPLNVSLVAMGIAFPYPSNCRVVVPRHVFVPAPLATSLTIHAQRNRQYMDGAVSAQLQIMFTSSTFSGII